MFEQPLVESADSDCVKARTNAIGIFITADKTMLCYREQRVNVTDDVSLCLACSPLRCPVFRETKTEVHTES